jgi:hypothetical protein
MPNMRAKMTVETVTLFPHGEQLKLRPVGRSDAYPADGTDEDNTYAKFSPSGSLELFVTNPALQGQFKPGQKYYLDFSPATS